MIEEKKFFYKKINISAAAITSLLTEYRIQNTGLQFNLMSIYLNQVIYY